MGDDDLAVVARVGPGTPVGTLLRRHWTPVALSADLAAGTARPARILGEDLTLYRDEAGTARAVGPRLRPPRHVPAHRPGRGRLPPLLLPRVAVRPVGPVRRAAGRARGLRPGRPHTRLPRRGVRRAGVRVAGRR